jgi:DNA repair protein RecO (recombination protein O)
LASCVSCGGAGPLGGFSPSAGGIVCAACEAGSFPLGEEAHRFLVLALARPLSETPEAPAAALSQADRAITETLEFHAHVRLRRVA